MAAVAACVIGLGTAAGGQLVDAPIPHDHGQSITPSFEGWFPNPDGTFSMSFGYLNRNRKEMLDIPVGPNNRFDPGPADRGQPTFFLPRRQTGVFTVVVPKDWGDKKLTWTITAHGETIAIPGHLRPEWRIDALKEVTSGNTPPVVRFSPTGQSGQGPGGTSGRLEARAGVPVVLAVWVSDDMVRKPREQEARRREPELGVVWGKFRGPGDVSFKDTAPPIDASGKAQTMVTFSAPGDHVLRVLAWDTSGPPARGIMAVGFQCCWTNGYVNVAVAPAR
jgi:hypothetical protein